jgi:hypothetical protein
MTPEERARTIEFIIQSQARLAAAQEQDRLDRIQFEEWSKTLLSQLHRISNQQTELLNQQTEPEPSVQRMDGWTSSMRTGFERPRAFKTKCWIFKGRRFAY